MGLQVSKMVGGGKAPDMCEALYRQHQAYLSLEKKYQTEVAFVAMVQDAFNHLKVGVWIGGEPHVRGLAVCLMHQPC